MPYYGDDEYDYERDYERDYARGRRPSPPRRNITDNRRYRSHLTTDMGGPLTRARSQGQDPRPIVNVYNDVIQDNYQRAESPYPPPVPSPRYRNRNSLGEELMDALDDLALDRRRSSPRRSRSRGRSDVGYRDDYFDWERRRRSEEERMRRDIEREALQREKENERLKREIEREQLEKEKEEKETKQRIIDDYKRKQKEDEEWAKDEEKRIRDKIKQEAIEAKEKEKKQREEVEAKQREEKEKKEKEEKEKLEEIDEALREHYMNRGYSKQYADRQVEIERIRRERSSSGAGDGLVGLGGLGRVGVGALVPAPPRFDDDLRNPVYAKIKREHIAIETLTYYGIEWEYDKRDRRYIIIKQEMTDSETQMLFEHTKQLREKRLPLLLEPPKDKPPQYAWYRKRDRSSSRVRKAGILRYED